MIRMSLNRDGLKLGGITWDKIFTNVWLMGYVDQPFSMIKEE
jgi:hypothetical protein